MRAHATADVLDERVPLEEAVAPADRDARAATLLADARDADALDRIVRLYRPLVHHLASRFSHRGEPLDDLIQVANLGLLKAANRFDLSAGVRFSTYAVPTIIGELKRHFRDTGWSMRVPRRLQERSLKLRSMMGSVAQELGRSPTIAELAARAGLEPEEVLEALDAAGAYRLGSIEPLPDEAMPAEEDLRFEAVEGWAEIAPLLRTLPRREQALLHFRFVEELTQREIAEKLDISQMHVSRLLRRTLADLRREAEARGLDPSSAG